MHHNYSAQVTYTGHFNTCDDRPQRHCFGPEEFEGVATAMVGLNRALEKAFARQDPSDWYGCDFRAAVAVHNGSPENPDHRVAYFDLLIREDGDFGAVTATLERTERYLCVLGDKSWFTRWDSRYPGLALVDCPFAGLDRLDNDEGLVIAWLDLHTGDLSVCRVELRTTKLASEPPLF